MYVSVDMCVCIYMNKYMCMHMHKPLYVNSSLILLYSSPQKQYATYRFSVCNCLLYGPCISQNRAKHCCSFHLIKYSSKYIAWVFYFDREYFKWYFDILQLYPTSRFSTILVCLLNVYFLCTDGPMALCINKVYIYIFSNAQDTY